jgi:hypothetical protein
MIQFHVTQQGAFSTKTLIPQPPLLGDNATTITHIPGTGTSLGFTVVSHNVNIAFDFKGLCFQTIECVCSNIVQRTVGTTVHVSNS